ncbi:MAG: hypothetical protein JOZ59_01190, partial [Candidatus Eremiobacteraeota bacterium]|nr:hypothetical protein [Candidatus Eremiobacteraeota bacterium]
TSHHAMVLTGLGYTVDANNRFAIDTSTGTPAVSVWDPWPRGYQDLPDGRRVLSPSEWDDVTALIAVFTKDT